MSTPPPGQPQPEKPRTLFENIYGDVQARTAQRRQRTPEQQVFVDDEDARRRGERLPPRPGAVKSDAPTGAWYAIAVLLPFIGIILGIVALTRNYTEQALMLLVTSFVIGPVFWILFWGVLINAGSS